MRKFEVGGVAVCGDKTYEVIKIYEYQYRPGSRVVPMVVLRRNDRKYVREIFRDQSTEFAAYGTGEGRDKLLRAVICPKVQRHA